VDDSPRVQGSPSGGGHSYRFREGFIRAEVIWWEDYVALGGEAKAREAGKLAIEGGTMS